jgi:hypothetical protein
MAVIEIDWHPTRRTLRQFAVLWLVAFSLVGLWAAYRHDSIGVALWLWGPAAVVGSVGLVFPPLMRPVYLSCICLAFPIGWTVSHLLLGLIYYGLITPIGSVMRLSGYDPMKRKFERGAGSYWVHHESGGDSPRYFRQF